MKKVLSLVLVLCMAVACFAFAPAGAEAVSEPLPIIAEENDTEVTIKPASWEMTKFGLNVWSYGIGSANASNNSYATPDGAFTLTSEAAALCPDVGGTKAVKIDLSKLFLNSAATTNFNMLTLIMEGAKFEAGQQYRLTFKTKCTAGAASKVDFAPSVANNIVSGTLDLNVTGELKEEWTTWTMTFVANPETNPDGYTSTIGPIVALDIECHKKADAAAGDAIYIDGIEVVQILDTDADKDGITNTLDPDVDGDGKANKFDRDIDGDGVKNVWDRDIDNDYVPNGDDDTPFGG